MDSYYCKINIDIYKKEINYHQNMITILNEKIKENEKKLEEYDKLSSSTNK